MDLIHDLQDGTVFLNQDFQDWYDAVASLGMLPLFITAPLDCGPSPQ